MKFYVILSLLVFSLQGFSKITPPKINIDEIFIKLKEFNDPTITRNFDGDFLKT